MGKTKLPKKVNKALADLLEKFLPRTGDAAVDDAARAALRKDPEKYNQYLNTLDQAYGDTATRSAEQGYDPKDWYHGSFADIQNLEPKQTKGTQPYLGKGTYLSTSPDDASNYASLYSEDNRYKVEKLAKHLSEKYGLNYTAAEEAAISKLTGGLDSGSVYPLRFRQGRSTPITVEDPLTFKDARNLVKNKDIAFMQPAMKWPHMPDVTLDDWHARIKDPSKIRSKFAAFDPRFKDSTDILAGTAGAATIGATVGGSDDAEAAPFDKARKLADEYAKIKKLAPIIHEAPDVKVNAKRAKALAEAYEALQHNPNDPEVRKAYDALVRETVEQFELLKDSGLKTTKILRGQDNPYKNSEQMIADIRENNHLSYLPTEQGFGSGVGGLADHPLLRNVSVGNESMPANDPFRIVHDYFGHAKEGAKFGPTGEENAWREHMKMFSPEAQKALTTETRGQNSWVNFGPKGEENKLNPKNTTYADQKAGLLPDWARLPAAGAIATSVGKSPDNNWSLENPYEFYQKNINQPRKAITDAAIDKVGDLTTLPGQSRAEDAISALKFVGDMASDPVTYVEGPAGLAAGFLLGSDDNAQENAENFSSLKQKLSQPRK